jgi:transcriptional regulator with XRE-family HTH domain
MNTSLLLSSSSLAFSPSPADPPFATQTLAAPRSEFVPAFVGAPDPLHRIREVRLEQEMTLRSIACRTGEARAKLAEEEMQHTDLTLSRLHWWRRALDVPIADLLVEPDAGLSPLIMERVRMLRIMKTVASIKRVAQSDRMRRLAEMLERQLLEVAPEMRGVIPWNSVGQRRTSDELGRAAEQMISVDELIGI